MSAAKLQRVVPYFCIQGSGFSLIATLVLVATLIGSDNPLADLGLSAAGAALFGGGMFLASRRKLRRALPETLTLQGADGMPSRWRGSVVPLLLAAVVAPGLSAEAGTMLVGIFGGAGIAGLALARWLRGWEKRDGSVLLQKPSWRHFVLFRVPMGSTPPSAGEAL